MKIWIAWIKANIKPMEDGYYSLRVIQRKWKQLLATGATNGETSKET